MLQVERVKHRDDISDIDRRHRTELQHLRQGYEESERAYKDRIERLEDHRRGVEEELSRLKAQQLTERLSLEEQILATKKQVKEEEVGHQNYSKDRATSCAAPDCSLDAILTRSSLPVKPRPEAHMDMILLEVFLKSIDLIPQQQILQRHYSYYR